MRLVFMTCIVVLCALDVALADDKPTVVAVWEHQVIGRDAKPSTMTLYSNHKINDPDGKSVWSRRGNTLTLRWLNPGVPGGKSMDYCRISPDGKTYTGQNQAGVKVSGKLVSVTADLKPKVAPKISRRIPGQTPAARRKATADVGGGGKPRVDIEALERLANSGNAKSMYKLGVYYCNGHFVAKDEKKGVAWLEKAAKAGHANAMNDLGCCYYYGTGVKKDLNLAKEWLSKAAHAGSPTAQRALAQVSGLKSWKDMSAKQKQQLAGVGLFVAAWLAASQSDDDVPTPACNSMSGFSKCPCIGYEPGGKLGNFDPNRCARCLHSDRDHNR